MFGTEFYYCITVTNENTFSTQIIILKTLNVSILLKRILVPHISEVNLFLCCVKGLLSVSHKMQVDVKYT